MASAADVASKELPPGTIHVSEFNPSSIHPNAHLFFDDDRKYIDPVQETMNARKLPVACVYCHPPASVVLHAHDTGAVSVITRPNQFREMKQQGTPRGEFRDFLGDHMEKNIGTGFTSAIISQLIEHERDAATMMSGRKRQRLYFFDFDRTLTFVPGLSFAFLPKKSKTRSAPSTEIPSSEHVLLSQYARYLFSDYCGEEPAEESGIGRMRLLRELFRVIGNERIYIVTANSSAKNVPENPYYMYFKFLISELLPDFLEDHIIGVHSTNEPPLFNSKQDAIESIILHSPSSPSSSSSPSSPRTPGGTVVTKKASPEKSRRSPSHGHGGRKRMSRKPYQRNRIRRSTRKRRN